MCLCVCVLHAECAGAYVLMSLYTEARGKCWVSFSFALHYFLETSLIEPETPYFGCAGQWCSQSPLSLYHNAGVRGVHVYT